MAKIHGAVVVNTERCKGCRLCVVACPCNVLNLRISFRVYGATRSLYRLPELCTCLPRCLHRGLPRDRELIVTNHLNYYRTI